jgi:HAD superfamily hydrolase (TIGR01549 family)
MSGEEEKMPLKLVLWDMGGTLIDYPVSLEKAGEVFEMHKEEIGLSSEFMKDWVGFYLAERKSGLKTTKEATFLSALASAMSKNNLAMSGMAAMDTLEFLYKKVFGEVAALIKGSKEVLSAVYDRKIPMGLISNTAWPGRFHEADLKRFGIFDYFDLRVWSSEEGIRKPHISLFLMALGHFGVSQSEAIYIGDTFSRDVVGPNNIGIPAILISNKPTPQAFNGWIAKDLFEVKEILSKMI